MRWKQNGHYHNAFQLQRLPLHLMHTLHNDTNSDWESTQAHESTEIACAFCPRNISHIVLSYMQLIYNKITANYVVFIYMPVCQFYINLSINFTVSHLSNFNECIENLK